MADRAFSRKCARCSQRTMQLATVSYSVQVVYDGRKYTVHLPDLTVPQCSNCQAISIDEAAGDQIDLAFRREAGLLTSDQIRENRERLDLTQEELAARLGIAMATLSRWETGSQVQQRAFDRFLRISSRSEDVRTALADERHMSGLGVAG